MIAGVGASAFLVMGFTAWGDYMPAHRGYVRVVVEERIKPIQLQVNTLRRDNLEKTKFDLTLKLRETTDNSTRALIEEKLRTINDDLTDVLAERSAIRGGP